MAILVLGKSVCPICNQVVRNGQRAVSFPPFVANELDPLFVFHDTSVHEACFQRHPLAETAARLLEEMREKTAPRNRHCNVCMRPIVDPDDYFALGHLVTAGDHALAPYNFAQFHRSCLPDWSERAHVKHLLEDLIASGEWRGRALRWALAGLSLANRESRDEGQERGEGPPSPSWSSVFSSPPR